MAILIVTGRPKGTQRDRERGRVRERGRERECGGLASVSVPSVLLISLRKEMCSAALWLLLHLDHKVASAKGRLEKSE